MKHSHEKGKITIAYILPTTVFVCLGTGSRSIALEIASAMRVPHKGICLYLLIN